MNEMANSDSEANTAEPTGDPELTATVILGNFRVGSHRESSQALTCHVAKTESQPRDHRVQFGGIRKLVASQDGGSAQPGRCERPHGPCHHIT